MTQRNAQRHKVLGGSTPDGGADADNGPGFARVPPPPGGAVRPQMGPSQSGRVPPSGVSMPSVPSPRQELDKDFPAPKEMVPDTMAPESAELSVWEKVRGTPLEGLVAGPVIEVGADGSPGGQLQVQGIRAQEGEVGRFRRRLMRSAKVGIPVLERIILNPLSADRDRMRAMQLLMEYSVGRPHAGGAGAGSGGVGGIVARVLVAGAPSGATVAVELSTNNGGNGGE